MWLYLGFLFVWCLFYPRAQLKKDLASRVFNHVSTNTAPLLQKTTVQRSLCHITLITPTVATVCGVSLQIAFVFLYVKGFILINVLTYRAARRNRRFERIMSFTTIKIIFKSCLAPFQSFGFAYQVNV